MRSILLVGVDSNLLGSRAALLKRTGCVTFCAGVGDALAWQEKHRADLIVLCHTVPELYALGITRVVHERWPCTRVLQVLPYGQEDLSGYATSADAVSASRPESLLRVTTELLRGIPGPPVEISQWKAPVYVH